MFLGNGKLISCLCLSLEMPNNAFLSQVLEKNASCERGVSRDNGSCETGNETGFNRHRK